MADVLLEPWRQPVPVATVPKPEEPIEAKLIASTQALNAGADHIVASRVLRSVAKDIREGRMAALPDRITEKLSKAAGVLQRRVAATEARADALIAREDALARREDEAFLPHEQAANTLEKQYDMVERSYDILGNGSSESAHASGKSDA